MFCLRADNLSSLPTLSHAFFGRLSGVSKGNFSSLNSSQTCGDCRKDVETNRKYICHEIGIENRMLFAAKQVHGAKLNRVFRDTSQSAVECEEADALWTSDKGVGVGVQTADCVPILLAHKEGAFVAAIHAGWRGAANGMIKSTINEICHLSGSNVFDIKAAIGPCIGERSFEVGQEVAEAAKMCRGSRFIVSPLGEGKYLVDLSKWVHNQIWDAGVRSIDVVKGDTFESKDKFFSYRASGGLTGRQMSVIALS